MPLFRLREIVRYLQPLFRQCLYAVLEHLNKTAQFQATAGSDFSEVCSGLAQQMAPYVYHVAKDDSGKFAETDQVLVTVLAHLIMSVEDVYASLPVGPATAHSSARSLGSVSAQSEDASTACDV